MRFQTSDPDIATIVRRIERKVIDLQPDFQRGEVWSTGKKQRLIDTILRKWHVPPIHLVAKGGGRFDVLDGQQRLTAIRDFMKGLFVVDASIDPLMSELVALDGLRFGQLPEEVRDEFEAFAIRVFELHDYTPDEPHELFFRLNQPVVLTEAEKRNAFIGPARNQVKELAEWAGERGMIPERIGFSNARMAYHDLLARLMLTLEQGCLTEKITSLRITTRYRKKEPFSESVMGRAATALEYFLEMPLLDNLGRGAKPNKATIHTWLCMAAKLDKENLFHLGPYLSDTIGIAERWRATKVPPMDLGPVDLPLTIFHDRATARVADVSSVVLRDMTAWMVMYKILEGTRGIPPFLAPLSSVWNETVETLDADRALSRASTSIKWGAPGWL